MARPDRMRLGVVGSGWIVPRHLAALGRLDRTELVGVVSGTADRAATLTARWGGRPYAELERMLDAERPDAVLVCLPPHRSVAACEALVGRGVPFLTEKPLAARSVDAERVGALVAARRLVVAVGYQWRGLDLLTALRTAIQESPPALLMARWTGPTPGPAWWRRVDESGGQTVEQATHLFDLARHLLGEGTVVAAASAKHPRPAHPDADVDDVSTAIVRFPGGTLASFTSSCLLPSPVVAIELIGEGRRSTLRLLDDPAGPGWTLELEDSGGRRTIEAVRDPYEVQAEAFLDAVATDDPGLVLCDYADALATDRLTRAVVAASGSSG